MRAAPALNESLCDSFSKPYLLGEASWKEVVKMDDSRIIELYMQRSEDAIGETDIKYGKLCRHIIRNILANELDGEECVNDTYFSVWNAIPMVFS